MTHVTPWQQRLASGTEDIQAEVIDWYQNTTDGKAYIPQMIWGTLQTEAYATVILQWVVSFHDTPDDVPAGVAKRMERQQVLRDGKHHYNVILGEQALYTNVGGPAVMREQMERLLADLDLPSLTLGITPRTSRTRTDAVRSLTSSGSVLPTRSRSLLPGLRSQVCAVSESRSLPLLSRNSRSGRRAERVAAHTT
ncbi:Scr1 family TA system antitoxin-like transcriptional regulator [Streptomyces sp. NPDC032198]|uniref:Scr1 family TA system antitoxin-like transcriptional regulator n=1 Tax=Streptomyces sp. NPDC032198 TaxID=3155127 RepID=UPI0033F9A997